MRLRVAVLVVCAGLAAMWMVGAARACVTGTVRDAGYSGKRNVHRLCVFAAAVDASADSIEKQMAAWLDKNGQDLNVQLERVNVDAADIDWRNYGIPSAPPKTPVVALIGEFPNPRRVFVIDHWDPGPTEDELAVLKTSPVREQLKERLTKDWAAILYAPGASEGSGAAENALRAVRRKWEAKQPPGVAVIRLDRNDPKERTLCAFAGVKPGGAAWAAVVFGRGKLMAPPLEGDEISESALNGMLDSLSVPCTCLQESTALGLDVPLEWESKLDALVATSAPAQGYVEIAVGGPVEGRGSRAEGRGPAPRVPETEKTRDRSGRLIALAVAPLGGAAVLVLLVAGLLLWRKQHDAA